MKKLLLIPSVLIVMTLTSCKKDYTCTCTSTGAATVTTIKEVSKETAKANCVSTTEVVGGNTYATTCALN